MEVVADRAARAAAERNARRGVFGDRVAVGGCDGVDEGCDGERVRRLWRMERDEGVKVREVSGVGRTKAEGWCLFDGGIVRRGGGTGRGIRRRRRRRRGSRGRRREVCVTLSPADRDFVEGRV